MKARLLQQLLDEPETVIENLDLVYITDEKMPIVRLKQGEDFKYRFLNKPLKRKKDLERISALVIPPAWQGVKITDLPNGHLQAVGRDAKKRKQYKYHTLWTKARKQTKFYRMSKFGAVLPNIRNVVDTHLEQEDWSKTKVLALVVRLMEETHIRIGNEQYAKRNKTYGLSTLRKRHVIIEPNKLKFQFKGKRGKEHSITLRNKKLIKMVSKCEEIPGWELFHYYDDKGDKQQIDSGMVNDYLKAISGMHFTAKDFRTWAAGVVFFNALMDMAPTSEPKQMNKNILQAYDHTARALGNTRNVCRKSYVHPLLPVAYEKGELDSYFKRTADSDTIKPNSSPSEVALQELISNYKPQF
jgi:DNA topoisomerase-1